MYRSKPFLFFIIISLTIVWSCAKTQTFVPNDMEAKSAPSVKEDSRTTLETSAQASRYAKIKMDAGEYHKAIEIYNIAYQKNRHDRTLLKEYTQSIEKIKVVADEMYNRENFLSAVIYYAILLKNYQSLGGYGVKLSFDKACLDEKFSLGRKMVSRQGFEEYRKGNLSQAIALWQALIDIDPINPEILKALNTAKLQQENLQK